MSNWFHEHKEIVVSIGLAVLLLTLGFGLGYRYAKDDSPAPIVIEKCSDVSP